jgi:hypothetical protein
VLKQAAFHGQFYETCDPANRHKGRLRLIGESTVNAQGPRLGAPLH